MKLVVGLGNPGEKYERDRHNTGFMVADALALKLSETFSENNKWNAETARSGDLVLIKPLTFMNNSGEAVGRVASFYKVSSEDVFLIHDDLDVVLGDYKIQKGVGPKIHNGVISVERHLGNKDFWRVRVGIDGREGDRSMPGDEYVLTNFRTDEKEVLEKTIEKIVEELMTIVSG